MGKVTKPEAAFQLILESCRLFRTDTSAGIALIESNGIYKPILIDSREFLLFARHLYRERHGVSLSAQQIQEARDECLSTAHFEGSPCTVYGRVGKTDDGFILIDPVWENYQILRVRPDGYDLVNSTEYETLFSGGRQVLFIRQPGSLPLPFPVKGQGTLSDLWRFVGRPDSETWLLLISWIVSTFFVDGPFPILVLIACAGSGKSSTTTALKRVVDPHTVDKLSPPKDLRDVYAALKVSWLLTYDNISSVPQWLSDVYCRTSTGGGTLERELFTNGETHIFTGKRPMALNGINDFLHNGDILSRAILYRPNPPERVIPEFKLWEEFRSVEPGIFFDLLRLLSDVLRVLPSIEVDEPFRMADFCRIGKAVEKTIPDAYDIYDTCDTFPPSFIKSYKHNIEGGDFTAIESSPVASVLLNYLQKNKEFNGTISELLSALQEFNPDITKNRYFPNSSTGLGSALRKIAPNLKNIGIEINFDRDAHNRSVYLKMTEKVSQPSQPDLEPIPPEEDPFPAKKPDTEEAP
jgi:hypothetical protein